MFVKFSKQLNNSILKKQNFKFESKYIFMVIFVIISQKNNLRIY